MIKAIISDADGTLVNTLYMIRHGQYETAVQYLIENKIPRSDIPDYDTYETYINKSVGGPTLDTLERTIKLLFGETHEQHLANINFDDINSRLTAVQDHIAPIYVHPFHGLTELFTWLGRTKTNFGIFTSGDRRMIIRNFGVSLPVMGYMDLFIADSISLDERFHAFIERARAVYGIPKIEIVTCEDVMKPKPNPEGLIMLKDRIGANSDEIIVLGDHMVDMEAAKAAGLHPIGISHGFGTPDELKAAGALLVVDDLASLPKIIEDHNSGKKPIF